MRRGRKAATTLPVLPVLHMWEPTRPISAAEWACFVASARNVAAAVPFGSDVRIVASDDEVTVDAPGAARAVALRPRDRMLALCLTDAAATATDSASRLLLMLRAACAPDAILVGSTASADAWAVTAALASIALGRPVAPPLMTGQLLPDKMLRLTAAACAAALRLERRSKGRSAILSAKSARPVGR